MTVGLGTGSTVHHALVRLAERIREENLSIRGVPTSLDTERKARSLGINLVDLADVRSLDVTIDGADEIDGELNMIKGGGGALLREKVVASISAREVICVGPGKTVERLGVRFRLPVEVVPFARPVVERALSSLGAQALLREGANGEPYRTDNGNQILDCRFEGGILDPRALEQRLAMIPGLVESGLFIGLAHVLVEADKSGKCSVREGPQEKARKSARG